MNLFNYAVHLVHVFRTNLTNLMNFMKAINYSWNSNLEVRSSIIRTSCIVLSINWIKQRKWTMKPKEQIVFYRKGCILYRLPIKARTLLCNIRCINQCMFYVRIPPKTVANCASFHVKSLVLSTHKALFPIIVIILFSLYHLQCILLEGTKW